MNDINIFVDVNISRPSWAKSDHSIAPQLSPKYRVYVDNDLLTERTWIWDDSMVIQENLWAKLDPGTHTLKLEPVVRIPGQAKFPLTNFKIDNVAFETTEITDLTITFTI